MKGIRKAGMLVVSALIVLTVLAPAAAARVTSGDGEAPNRVLRTGIMLGDQRHGTLIAKEYDRGVLFINTASERNYGTPTRRAIIVMDLTADKVWKVNVIRPYYSKIYVRLPRGHKVEAIGITGTKNPDRRAGGALTFTKRPPD